jgi:hypothetical protein
MKSFLGYFTGCPKHHRSLIGNPVLGTSVTVWRKTKRIFEISSSSCIEPYIHNSFWRKFRSISTSKLDPKRAQIFTKCSYICHISPECNHLNCKDELFDWTLNCWTIESTSRNLNIAYVVEFFALIVLVKEISDRSIINGTRVKILKSHVFLTLGSNLIQASLIIRRSEKIFLAKWSVKKALKNLIS